MFNRNQRWIPVTLAAIALLSWALASTEAKVATPKINPALSENSSKTLGSPQPNQTAFVVKSSQIADPEMEKSPEQQVLEKCQAQNPKASIAQCQGLIHQKKMQNLFQWAKTIEKNIEHENSEELIKGFVRLLENGGAQTPGLLKKLEAIVEELEKRNPRSPIPDRMKLAIFIMGSHDNSKLARDPNFQKALQQAREQHPEDWQIYELQLFTWGQTNPLNYEKEIAKILSRDPLSLIGRYHTACLHWNQGARELTQTELKSLMASFPSEQRLESTLEKTRTQSMGQSPCSMTLNFSPEDFQ